MNKISSVLKPPANGPAFQPNTEAESFVSLPADFWQFLSEYGGGAINDSIYIYQPDHPTVGFNMQSNVESELVAMRGLNEQFPESYTFSKYPNEGGFLPWARSSDGDTFFGWITGGDTNDWPVATVDDEGIITNHDIPFAEFLLKLCSNKLSGVDLPDDFFDGGLTFDSIGG